MGGHILVQTEKKKKKKGIRIQINVFYLTIEFKNKNKQWSLLTSDSWGKKGGNKCFIFMPKKKKVGIYCCGMCGWKMKKMVKSLMDVE